MRQNGDGVFPASLAFEFEATTAPGSPRVPLRFSPTTLLGLAVASVWRVASPTARPQVAVSQIALHHSVI
jgi:hypothetical protein